MLPTNLSQKSTPIVLPSRYEQEDGRPSSQLTEQQIDVWEHAALLYHGYEWQEAADMFNTLSTSIESRERRALCLLNISLIQSRLGEYDDAFLAVEEAAQIYQSMLLIPFLMGFIAHQLQDYAKAELCFEVCYDCLSHGGVDYSDVENDFVLDREMILNNLRAARSAQYSARFAGEAGGTVKPIDAIPAEYIFEAPPRPESQEETAVEGAESSFRKLFKNKRPKSLQDLLPTGKASRPYSPGPAFWLENLQSPPSLYSPPHQDQLSSIPEDAQSPTELKQKSPMGEPSTSPPVRQTARYHDAHRSWRGRPSTPYMPRDARVGGDSTKELASFIRKGGQTKVLTPRDARGEYKSVKELASFIQLYAPEKSGRASPEPLDLDPHRIANLRLEHLLNRGYDEPLAISPTVQSPPRDTPGSPPTMVHQISCPSGILRRLKGEVAPSQRDSASSGSERFSVVNISSRGESAVEVLKRTVYNPAASTKEKPAAPNLTQASSNLPGSNAITPPSTSPSSGSLYKGIAATDRRDLGAVRSRCSKVTRALNERLLTTYA